MEAKKKRIKILETKYFGFIIGLIVFIIFLWLSFGVKTVQNIEQDVVLDIYFKFKDFANPEKKWEGVTIVSGKNPFVSQDIVIAGIDAKSLYQFGKWPFPRSIEASFLNTLSRITDDNKRERAVFLDINFIEPDTNAPENDILLIEAIKENERVFLDTFLNPSSISGSMAEEYIERQIFLTEKYGKMPEIIGDKSKMPTFRGVEAPLIPYADAIRGYGNATHLKDVDDVYRRQPLIARFSVVVEEIILSDLTVNTPVDPENNERIVWIDKTGILHEVPLPLTDEIISRVKNEMIANAPTVIQVEGEVNESHFAVRKFKDYFIPSITLGLALEYFNKDFSDLEIILGEYIRIPNPQQFNDDTKEWEPYQLFIDSTDAGDKYETLDEITIPIDETGAMLINFIGRRSNIDDPEDQRFSVKSFTGYVKDPGKNLETWPESKYLDNKIVMVGIFATGLAEDEKPTPYGLMYGVEIIANSLNTILMNRFLAYADWWVNVLILLGFIMIVCFMTSRLSTIWALVAVLVMVLAYFITATTVFSMGAYILNLVTPILAAFLTYLSVVAYRAVTEERDKRRIKGMFGKYVSPTVVEQMMDNPPELGGVDKELSVFFSDIRGFTTLSESMTPQALVNHLNTYLTVMTDIIMDYNGTLDKYVGDEIMCFWGAPLPQEEHAILACKCAITQMDSLRKLNEKWPPEKRINIGIGINSGIMTVGNMGSMGRMNYTLMGDNVNLGARLEGTNKQYLTNIIISEYTYALVKDRIIARELDNIRVKGKNKPVVIYELVDIL
jgi:adenylate cyclase